MASTPNDADWAYDFASGLSLEGILDRFNAAGPWRWEMREGSWYGDYLNAHPAEGARVRIHEYPGGGPGGAFIGLRDKGFTALLRIEAEDAAGRSEIDAVFRGLLEGIRATGRTEIEPYD